MKVNEVYRQPVVLFHGTSSALLRSILTNGVEADPQQKVWDQDPDANVNTLNRVSLPGSYWTSNLLTASGAAWNAIKKFGGNKLYVCALINEQSAFADEDSINSKIIWAYSDAVGAVLPNVAAGAIGVHMGWFLYDPTKHQQAKHLFTQNLHKNLMGSVNNPMDPRLEQIFDDYLYRQFAYEYRDKNSLRNWMSMNRLEQMPPIPTPEQADHQFLLDREWLTKRYRASAYQANDTMNHTLRIPNTVGYRGHNRIICVLEEPTGETPTRYRDRRLFLKYGQVPQAFIDEWTSKIGKWYGVVKETKKAPVPQLVGTGKDFRQNPGVNNSPPQPGKLAGSGKPLKVKPGFVG